MFNESWVLFRCRERDTMVVLINDAHTVIKTDGEWVVVDINGHELHNQHRYNRIRRLIPEDSVRLDVERHLAMVASTSSGA